MRSRVWKSAHMAISQSPESVNPNLGNSHNTSNTATPIASSYPFAIKIVT